MAITFDGFSRHIVQTTPDLFAVSSGNFKSVLLLIIDWAFSLFFNACLLDFIEAYLASATAPRILKQKPKTMPLQILTLLWYYISLFKYLTASLKPPATNVATLVKYNWFLWALYATVPINVRLLPSHAKVEMRSKWLYFFVDEL